MPSNFTENYNLSQWKKSDQVRMEDFNEDNAKIDGALKAETDARAAADSVINAALALRGNCQFYSYSYTGDGQCGQNYRKVLQFPWPPDLVLLSDQYGNAAVLFPGMSQTRALASTGSEDTYSTWNGNTVYLTTNHYNEVYGFFNRQGVKYTVFAFRTLS